MPGIRKWDYVRYQGRDWITLQTFATGTARIQALREGTPAPIRHVRVDRLEAVPMGFDHYGPGGLTPDE